MAHRKAVSEATLVVKDLKKMRPDVQSVYAITKFSLGVYKLQGVSVKAHYEEVWEVSD